MASLNNYYNDLTLEPGLLKLSFSESFLPAMIVVLLFNL